VTDIGTTNSHLPSHSSKQKSPMPAKGASGGS
jgi:hypothetical protein